MLEFVSPSTKNPLTLRDGKLLDSVTGEVVGRVDGSIPRFVPPEDNYAESFGWQWNHWEHVLSESRGAAYQHARDLRERSGLWDGAYDPRGKRLLECGMGGGDDTEVLLTLPLAELHAFDLSSSVERAAKYLTDPRLRISQASIYAIPYPDEAFDIVWCHRVVQHTPDPEAAIRHVCRKLKPGGFLFLHSYKRSWRHMLEYRYKYRWLTKRLTKEHVYQFVDNWGPRLHALNRVLYRRWLTKWLAYNFIPFCKAPVGGVFSEMSDAEALELEKMQTFDALTPRYDNPMSSKRFQRILAEENVTITHLHDPPTSPLLARGIKRHSPPSSR